MEPTKRIIGIDYARAFFSICVVCIHIGYFSPSIIFSHEFYNSHQFVFSDFINFYILCLAVPVFFIIANYLFASKPYDWRNLSRGLFRNVKLALFWSIVYNLIARNVIFHPRSPENVMEALALLLSGNNTLYYFFVSLVILTIITHFAKLLSNYNLIVLIVLSTVIVGILPIISLKYQFYLLSIYWNPLNFLPYPFAAVLIQRLRSENLRNVYWYVIILFLMVSSLFAALLDWTVYVDELFFKANSYAIPTYTRPSLITLSILVLVLALNIKVKKNPVIDFMAKRSLALYCLHYFFLPVGIMLVNILELKNFMGWMVYLITVVLMSYIFSLVLPFFIKKDLLR